MDPKGIWQGETVAIFATGPSMSRAVAEQMRGTRAIAVKESIELAPEADALASFDSGWWKSTPSAAHFPGLKVCGQPGVFGAFYFPTRYERVRLGPAHVLEFRSSGIMAIRFAAYAGATNIRLFGFDGGPGHWKDGRSARSAETIEAADAGLIAVIAEMKAQGVEVTREAAPTLPEAFGKPFKGRRG